MATVRTVAIGPGMDHTTHLRPGKTQCDGVARISNPGRCEAARTPTGRPGARPPWLRTHGEATLPVRIA